MSSLLCGCQNAVGNDLHLLSHFITNSEGCIPLLSTWFTPMSLKDLRQTIPGSPAVMATQNVWLASLPLVISRLTSCALLNYSKM